MVKKRPELDEGPFLWEERALLDAIAEEIANFLIGRQAEQDKLNLEEQVRHADRLATIGQLAAGVAHELNEPLGSILGFAQLAKKCPGLPRQAELDIEKISNASLLARDIVKKLLIFARQMPPQKIKVNVNQLVEEVLNFFKSRCTQEGVQLICSLSPNLPGVDADLFSVESSRHEPHRQCPASHAPGRESKNTDVIRRQSSLAHRRRYRHRDE